MSSPASESVARAEVSILFVTGTGHSGSTLIANLLGAVPGFVSVGELRYLWERGLEDGGLCGCGRRLRLCPFWSAVLARAQAADEASISTAQQVENALLRVRRVPRLLRARGESTALGPAAVRYVDQLQRVLAAVREVAPGAVIIDSSKLPSYGYLLSKVDGLDVKVLHLVRDPRAAAHSWNRARSLTPDQVGPHHIRHEAPVKSVVLWNLWNTVAERLWGGHPRRYIRLRYEDVVVDPVRALTPVLAMLGFPDGRIPVAADGLVDLPTSHTVAGNPNRMTSGPVLVRTDTAWIDRLSRRDRTVVTWLASPLLRHFGYPLRPASSS
jgi:hypothetical protein